MPQQHRSALCRHRRLRLELLETRANPSNTLTVDDDGAQNSNADFTTIQAAVDAAAPYDRILVYKGVYNEQVVIPATKDGVQLRAVNGDGWHDCDSHGGSGPGVVVIAPSVFADPTEAVVHVAGAKNVNIEGFKISGENAPPGATFGANFGVLVDMQGSATVRNNHITTIRDLPLTGEQDGIGVQFGFTDSAGQLLGSGRGEARGNVIDDYQKGGVVVIGSGSHATVRSNVVTGQGPTDAIAQNGIQVSNDAAADICGNRVTRNNYTKTEVVSVGILVFETSGVTIRENFTQFNNDGILLYFGDNSAVEGNVSRNNTHHGIGLFEADNVRVRLNAATNNGRDGIAIENSRNNRIELNLAAFNGRYGIALEPTAEHNVVRFNAVFGNQVGNIFVGNPNNIVANNIP